MVAIAFDPACPDCADLLAVFFAIHDPTTPNRQGNDVGPSTDHHHRYFERNQGAPYCAFVVAPKVAKFRNRFAARLTRRTGNA